MTVFGAFEIAAFVIACGGAAMLWRRDQAAAVRLASFLTLCALLFVLAICASGIPLLLHRFGRTTIAPAAASPLATAHHYAGHWTLAAWVAVWPFVLIVSARRPPTALGKVALTAVTMVALVAMLVQSFTGYALPRGMPRELAPHELPHALRFVVLHALATPALLAIPLTLLLWRHGRATRRDRQESPR